jgi:ubiquinone/menaquinone biosynthesis C-methylase UbiE
VDALAAFRPRRILDVGCGTGLLTTRLHRELPDAAIVGCDFSHGMLVQARAHAGRGAWVQGDALRLPIRDATADAIVSTEAFHWFPDQPRALAEFARVLAPGGRVLIALVNTPNDVVGEVFRIGSRILGQPLDWPTRARMRALCEGAGLQIESQHRIFRIPAGLLLPPVLTIAIRPGGPT